jgi:hypothetical protein
MVFSVVTRGFGVETGRASGMAGLRGARPHGGDAVMSLAGADGSQAVGMALGIGVVSGVGVGRRRGVVVVGMEVSCARSRWRLVR